MNSYTITDIDTTTNSVYVTFEYDDHALDHTIFVDDLNNADSIRATIRADYDKFKQDVDIAMRTPVLPPEVEGLIGIPQGVE